MFTQNMFSDLCSDLPLGRHIDLNVLRLMRQWALFVEARCQAAKETAETPATHDVPAPLYNAPTLSGEGTLPERRNHV
jgi:hypothetical protein